MIHIRKNTSQQVYITVNELLINSDPVVYVFTFTSENGEDVALTATLNAIASSDRGQTFEINEGVDVVFPSTGYYRYTVRQQAQGNLLETGILRVISEEETVIEYTNNDNTIIYGNQ